MVPGSYFLRRHVAISVYAVDCHMYFENNAFSGWFSSLGTGKSVQESILESVENGDEQTRVE